MGFRMKDYLIVVLVFAFFLGLAVVFGETI